MVDGTKDETPEVEDAPRHLRELAAATTEFRTNYKRFAEKHKEFLMLDDDLQASLTNMSGEKDVRLAAQALETRLRITVQAVGKKDESLEGKWTTKVGNFLKKLYPVSQLALSLTAAVSDVNAFLYGIDL
jgi:hypothetical protein